MRTLRILLQALLVLTVAACADRGIVSPGAGDPSYSAASNGHYLRDLDTQIAVGPDTTVQLGDVLRVGLAAGNGNGPQNNKNVKWSTSNAAVVSVSPDRGTATLTAQGAGTAVVTATLGGNAVSVTITVAAAPPTNTPPVAAPDAYDAIGNVAIPVAAPGVLANDSDAEGPVTVVPGTFATVGGGAVTIAADGSFAYRSAAGFTGVDQFTYTATDGTATSTGTVTLSVPERVWYVKNDAPAPGDGRDSTPFATLAQAQSASAVGETIFVYRGDGTSSGMAAGITLQSGQSLIGQGVPANVTRTVNGQTVVLLAAGGAPTVAGSGSQAAVQLGTNNTVRGLALQSSGSPSVRGAGFGTFTASDVSAQSSGSPVLDLQTGSLAAAFRSLSATGGSTGVKLSGTTGALSVTGDGSTLGSGGTIESATGAGLTLSGATDVSLSYVRVRNNGGSGIEATGLSGLTLTGSAVTDNGDANGEVGLHLAELRGTATVSGTTISGSARQNILVQSSGASTPAPGAPDQLVVTGSTITGAGAGSDVILVSLSSGANFHTRVLGSTVSSGPLECIEVNASGASSSRFTMTGSSVSGCSSAVNLVGSGSSATVVDVTGNPLIRAGVGTGVNILATGAATVRGTVGSNTNVGSSAANNNGIGIDVIVDGTGSAVVELLGNTVTGYSIGVRGGSRGSGAGSADLTLANNNVTAGGGANELAGVYLVSGNGSPAEAKRTCVSLTNNQASAPGAFAFGDYVLEQYAGNVFQLQGFAGDGTDPAVVAAFVSSRDVGGASVVPDAGAIVDYSAGSCATP
jgi:hypothetical protein